MPITPEELLTCVATMSAGQRAMLCEMLDPVMETDADIEAEVKAIQLRVNEIMGVAVGPDSAAGNTVQENVKAMLAKFDRGSQGPEGPSLEDHFLTIIGCHRMFPPGFKPSAADAQAVGVIRQATPEMVSQLLYRQMTGRNLDMSSVQPEVATADDTEAVKPLEPVIHDARPCNARARWQQLFNEAEIPMAGSLNNEAELSLIEGMIYDKGVKGLVPPRCTCGCGYVIGCRKTVGLHHIEG